MRRSLGITLSAILVFSGSTYAVLSAIEAFLGLKRLAEAGIPLHAPVGRSVIVYVVVASVVAGSWGIVSGIGLLMLRKWARICMLIFSVLLLSQWVVTLPLFPYSPVLPVPLIPPAWLNMLAGVGLKLHVALTILWAALGVGWLWFFSRRSVKEQFGKGPRVCSGAVERSE